ncbi:threonine-phosphate decarboxylase CobD [Camelimonas lactis]|nr:threonine-phosphate decarboxylase CobD [Camelimonas lactis]
MDANSAMGGPGAPDPGVIVHGGSLVQAAALFPDAPAPWIDLSTGINPHPHTRRPTPSALLTRLPEPARHARLCAVAAETWGVAPGAEVVAAPGTQILLAQVMMLARPTSARPARTMILAPTYAGHADAARVAGHEVICHQAATPDDLAALADADVAVVVNPNNPDGRVTGRAALLRLAEALARKGGLLVVDEAFIDACPAAESLAGDVGRDDLGGALVVLRSFGKFYGLAGVRLGFAIAAPAQAARLNAILGPWAVSGPAVEYGLAALQDDAWRNAMIRRLTAEAARLDQRLAAAGLAATGDVSLFRLVRHPRAHDLFVALGRRGLWVRRFEAISGVGCDAIRIGLPPDKTATHRLDSALQEFSSTI